MKIELKNFKHFPSLSEETNAFSATIHVNGKKAGACDNRGQGGCADYYFELPSLRQTVEKFVESLPEETWEYDEEKFSRKQNLSDYLDDLASKIIDQKEAEKLVKKAQKVKADAFKHGANVVFQIDHGYEVSWMPLKVATEVSHSQLIAAIAKKHKVSEAKVTVV